MEGSTFSTYDCLSLLKSHPSAELSVCLSVLVFPASLSKPPGQSCWVEG